MHFCLRKNQTIYIGVSILYFAIDEAQPVGSIFDDMFASKWLWIIIYVSIAVQTLLIIGFYHILGV